VEIVEITGALVIRCHSVSVETMRCCEALEKKLEDEWGRSKNTQNAVSRVCLGSYFGVCIGWLTQVFS
jgi:hypothetical protein